MAVVELAKEFASTLSDGQLSELSQRYSLRNVANWSNFPQAVLGRRGRAGLGTGTLSSGQWSALDALLAAAAGPGGGGGLDKIQQHPLADDYLREHGIPPPGSATRHPQLQ